MGILSYARIFVEIFNVKMMIFAGIKKNSWFRPVDLRPNESGRLTLGTHYIISTES